MRSIKLLLVVGLLLAGLATFGVNGAFAHGSNNAVYFQTNTEPDNYVQSYFRNHDGTLDQGPLVATGGSGENTASPFHEHGFPLLDSANSVLLSEDGRLLFAVNAGSDTISSFEVTRHGLELADEISSRGDLPVSIAVTDRGPGTALVYVLNEWSGNIAGFTADRDGDLRFLQGSMRSLSVSGDDGAAAMIGFDHDSRTLTVSQRGAIFNPVTGEFIGTGPDLIDVFRMHNGRPGPAIQHPSVGEDPFGFAYTRRDHLVMSDSGIFGTATTYDLDSHSGDLTPIGHVATGGKAPCWVVLTNDDKFAYITNSLFPPPAISIMSIGRHGEIALIGTAPTTNNAALDEDSSDDGRFLYVLNTLVLPVDPTHFNFVETRVDQFRINRSTGAITFIGTTDPVPFGGASGLTAR